jgi:hypothetical protein
MIQNHFTKIVLHVFLELLLHLHRCPIFNEIDVLGLVSFLIERACFEIIGAVHHHLFKVM